MEIHGLDARRGEPAFAFLVLRLREPATKDELIELIRGIAALVPAPEAFISDLPSSLDAEMRIVGMPWVPAASEAGVIEQRAALRAASDIAEVWCFQATESPPALEIDDIPFPVDGFPAIIDELDWEDFGLALKLAGRWQPGESTVLLGFHALWLAPYAGTYRNAAVTIDTIHHAAHLWVDRFAVEVEPERLVEHLLWIARAIHHVVPVVHARFGGATMAQKYAGLLGDTSEPFVLGGNPLLAVHADGGEDAVDAWIADPGPWDRAEIAQMLRELAIDIVTESSGDTVAAGEQTTAVAPDEPDKAEPHRAPADRSITRHAAEVLAARARAGALDARAASRLRPLLDVADSSEHRRGAVVEILGAARDREAVPQLVKILETVTIASALDAIGREDLLVKTARALGAIGDAAAVPALTAVMRAEGPPDDKLRPAAAEALAVLDTLRAPPIDDEMN